MCRAKHELSDEGAGLLPVNQYALQELPLKRLQQPEENGGQQDECKSCGEQAPVVAWCEDCDTMICQQCLNQHKKLAVLRDHLIKPFKKCKQDATESTTENKSELQEKQNMFSKCLRHGNERLKFLCTTCSELVCSDCLLLGSHREHSNRLVEGARHSLETKIEEFVALTENKNQEFSEYLVKASKAESEALEYSELMKTRVNNVFDGIVASVEAQRNEALQSVSQEVKEIWAQMEMVEVSLAQLDSFTRFADHTHKCTNNTSYVAMAAQGIKLMERLKDTRGDESTLNKKIYIGSHFRGDNPLQVPLNNGLFSLGQLSLKFSPLPGSVIPNLYHGTNTINVEVSLVAGELPVLFPPIPIDDCKLDFDVDAVYGQSSLCGTDVIIADQSTWKLTFKILRSTSKGYKTSPLTVKCRVSGAVTIETEVTYIA